MTTTVKAIYDGEVFRPDEPVDLPANTPVDLTVRTTADGDVLSQPYAWLDILEGAHIKGPADASEQLDDYLYHQKPWDSEPSLP